MLPVIKLNFRIMIRFLLLFQLSSPLDSFTATHFSCHLQAHLSSPTKGEKNFKQQGVIRKKKSCQEHFSDSFTHLNCRNKSVTFFVEILLHCHILIRNFYNLDQELRLKSQLNSIAVLQRSRNHLRV